MRTFRQGRYSGYLRPISYIIDLCVINGLALLYFFKHIDPFTFVLVISSAWIILSSASKFYEVYRYTREVTILSLILRQMMLFTLIIFAFSGYNQKFHIAPNAAILYVLLAFLLITIFKFAIYYLLQKYRVAFGGNYRKTVILGDSKKAIALETFFNEKPEYGYIHKKTFNLQDRSVDALKPSFDYILSNGIDEIYCSISELSNVQIAELTQFADNNLKIIKFLPDNKEIYSKKLKYEYYEYIPILTLREIPLDDSINTVIKRSFDILLSCFIIIFILSWLTPILAILIKLDSKGPVFFKQSRNGFNYEEFECYKFRSMYPNATAHLNQATRGDHRVTKVGAFLRKTSLDELPQFINVLFGDMSVVGPRPHMVSHANNYAKRIDKFMVRHFVKPGITGLAQIRGFRGEVETDKDIIGRVKYDIYYIENWSLLLDFKIILRTLYNALRGEDKAY
ncbi:putative colanic acid biosynthesis UDP-glucose lipid carrier transferase [Gelidibacter sediminis]|uniref:Putative colanic acid biosynthesis UDP-glucose lipid carrier transferase n=1 Tax=Gelidibacter sediminis TaxID=1608710 RepID=A0A4R7Q9W5_9FLAO|nr:undecaprenyl-phosphate glucose phosphotransferase [Gelidibacter sediminis]TDU43550.1 putative colanic acid biosynthesis UDP-glucose lipid carrier transferase [Gelidibacter sediminis]